MAAKDRNTPQKIKNEGTYTSDELGSYTLQDGTRVVEPPEGDIKRPLCAGIDVHKEILMAAICKTNPETLKADFMSDSSSPQTSTSATWRSGY